MRPVEVLDLHSQIFGEERRDPVLESSALFVGERKVVGIGADSQQLGLVGVSTSGEESNRRAGDQQEASLHAGLLGLSRR